MTTSLLLCYNHAEVIDLGFNVNITQFEGPLDLMLHLIKEHELDLFDLDISILADQYLQYLNQMDHLHLELESEYLVELATLIEYKSHRLLPKDDSKLDAEYEEDPKERLVRRLIEYQQFKEVSAALNDLHQERQLHLSRPLSLESEQWSQSESYEQLDGNPYDLVKAMMKCLRRAQLSKPIETRYTKKELSVDDRKLQITARLRVLPKTFTFENLLEDCESMHESIVTFLAVLELAKNQILFFTVDDHDTIWFERGNG